jgi:hypothetical protein
VGCEQGRAANLKTNVHQPMRQRFAAVLAVLGREEGEAHGPPRGKWGPVRAQRRAAKACCGAARQPQRPRRRRVPARRTRGRRESAPLTGAWNAPTVRVRSGDFRGLGPARLVQCHASYAPGAGLGRCPRKILGRATGRLAAPVRTQGGAWSRGPSGEGEGAGRGGREDVALGESRLASRAGWRIQGQRSMSGRRPGQEQNGCRRWPGAATAQHG